DRVLDLRRVPLPSDQALGRVDGVLGIGDGLALGDVPDQPLTRFRDRDDAGRGLVSTSVRDDDGRVALQNGDAGIRRSEVDADYTLHTEPFPSPSGSASSLTAFESPYPIADCIILGRQRRGALEFGQPALLHAGHDVNSGECYPGLSVLRGERDGTPGVFAREPKV